MTEYSSWVWKPGNRPVDSGAARRFKTLVRWAIAFHACVLLGAIAGTVAGATLPMPLWLMLLAGLTLSLGFGQWPLKAKASAFLTLTGFTLSVASAALILTTALSR